MSAKLVDAVLHEPVIVFGSLPPAGRDLDLLVPAELYSELFARLGSQGWCQRGGTSAHFADGTAYAVDIALLEKWAPTPAAARRLHSQATQIDGYAHLLAPAAPHQLLILARRWSNGMPLDQKKRDALARFSDDDWANAKSEAGEWDLDSALHELRSELSTHPETPATRRTSYARRRGPLVISLSGVDGSGKSTQAHHLRSALTALGFETEVQWTRITQEPLSRFLAAWTTRVMARLPVAMRESTSSTQTAELDDAGEVRNYPDGPPLPPDAGKLLRRQSRLLTWGWAVVVACGNGIHHRRTLRRHAGRVVVCDRYVLDSLVHLHYRYGVESPLRLPRSLVRLLSPRPICSFFLDVPPAIARTRKPEEYITTELATFRQLYLRQARKSRLIVIDASRPVEAIASDIARASWEALEARGRRPRLLRLIPRRR